MNMYVIIENFYANISNKIIQISIITSKSRKGRKFAIKKLTRHASFY